jgi:hypothetical protein
MGYVLIFSNSVDQTPDLALASFLKNANIDGLVKSQHHPSTGRRVDGSLSTGFVEA